MIQQLVNSSDEKAIPNGSKVKQKHFRTSEKDLPQLSFRARFLESTAELEQIEGDWNRLVETAIRKNPFFDPDFLIPAFRHLNQHGAKVLVVEAQQRVHLQGPPVLCALFPVIKRRIYGLPFSCLEVWKHDQCFDCTPLVRHDCTKEVLEFVFEFLGSQEKISLLSLNTICGEGTLANTLTDLFYRNSMTVFHRDEFVRACFEPSVDADAYITGQVSKNTRKGTRRLQRKLAEKGRLSTHISSTENGLETWIEDFLKLELSGWKGQSGTALGSTNSSRGFFCEMASRTLANKKMVMLKISLDDKPISILCDLHQQDRGIAFKTAFDESLKDFSPGLIAELENIHRLHDSNVQFLDSCADPEHSMINRVWSNRIKYQSLVIALRGELSRLATASMPIIQLGSEIIRKTRKRR